MNPAQAHPLGAVLANAARGVFPAPDGTVAVVRRSRLYRAAVVAFTAHSFIATDLPPDEVRAQLPDDDFGAPMSAGFLAWLGHRLGSTPGVLDVVLVHTGSTVGPEQPLLPYVGSAEHPRLARARRLRREVQAYADSAGSGLVLLGRGLAERWEISLELAPGARGKGVGRTMIAAALTLLPPGEPVFAQVSPGNALSLRAFLAAGFKPIGSEVLFP